MIQSPILRAQTDILAEFRKRMRDPSGDNARWSDGEIYDAINIALYEWDGRVQVPRYYDIDFVSGTYEYTLPSYIDTAHLDIQAQRTIWGLEIDGDAWETVYEDVVAWHVIPSSTGGQTVVIESRVNTVDGRLIWWGHNGELPTTIPATEEEIDDDDTSVELDALVTPLGRVGYVKINEEWIGYSGYTDDGSNTTLTNLVRNLDGTTADTHTSGSDVDFGVAVPTDRLWQQLFNQVGAYLHLLFITDGSSTETETHERMLGYFKEEVRDFWKSWVPIRPAKMKLSRAALGEPVL